MWVNFCNFHTVLYIHLKNFTYLFASEAMVCLMTIFGRRDRFPRDSNVMVLISSILGGLEKSNNWGNSFCPSCSGFLALSAERLFLRQEMRWCMISRKIEKIWKFWKKAKNFVKSYLKTYKDLCRSLSDLLRYSFLLFLQNCKIIICHSVEISRIIIVLTTFQIIFQIRLVHRSLLWKVEILLQRPVLTQLW